MHTESGLLNGSTLCLTQSELWDFIWVNNPDKSKSTSNKCRSVIDTIYKKPGNEYPFTNYQYNWILERLYKYTVFNNLFPDVQITDFKVVK
jgi:signal peptidase I